MKCINNCLKIKITLKIYKKIKYIKKKLSLKNYYLKSQKCKIIEYVNNNLK